MELPFDDDRAGLVVYLEELGYAVEEVPYDGAPWGSPSRTYLVGR